MFSGTVMENLRFGRPEAADEEVHAAAQRLGTHEMLLRLPVGYATPVGERVPPQRRERQLITITRAMVAEPRILILDEATSAVDPQTGRSSSTLEELFAKRTSLSSRTV